MMTFNVLPIIKPVKLMISERKLHVQIIWPILMRHFAFELLADTNVTMCERRDLDQNHFQFSA